MQDRQVNIVSCVIEKQELERLRAVLNSLVQDRMHMFFIKQTGVPPKPSTSLDLVK